MLSDKMVIVLDSGITSSAQDYNLTVNYKRFFSQNYNNNFHGIITQQPFIKYTNINMKSFIFTYSTLWAIHIPIEAKNSK